MLTILASVNDIPRIQPLLWSLSTNKPKEKFELVIIDLIDSIELIKQHLNNFRSIFKWSLYKRGETPLINIIQTDNILRLPASCIPFNDAINKTLESKSSISTTKLSGASLAFSTNKYSNNLNQSIINDCYDCEEKILYGTKGFILENHAGIITHQNNDYIVLSAGKEQCVDKVDLVEKNY